MEGTLTRPHGASGHGVAREIEGAAPINHGERVLCLSHGFAYHAKKRGTKVYSWEAKASTVMCQLRRWVSARTLSRRDCPETGPARGHLLCHGARRAVHILVDEDPARGVEVEG